MVSLPLPSEVFAGDGDSTLMDLMDTAHAHDHDDLDEEVLEKDVRWSSWAIIYGDTRDILDRLRNGCLPYRPTAQPTRGVKDLLFTGIAETHS